MSAQLWVVIPKWTTFQHYTDRAPAWIKVYAELLHDDAYLELSGHDRAVLLGLWLEYASSHGQLRVDTLSLSRRLGLRVTRRTLERLNHAGFVEFAASKPLALARARERARERGSYRAPQSGRRPPPRKGGAGRQNHNPPTADDEYGTTMTYAEYLAALDEGRLPAPEAS